MASLPHPGRLASRCRAIRTELTQKPSQLVGLLEDAVTPRNGWYTRRCLTMLTTVVNLMQVGALVAPGLKRGEIRLCGASRSLVLFSWR